MALTRRQREIYDYVKANSSPRRATRPASRRSGLHVRAVAPWRPSTSTSSTSSRRGYLRKAWNRSRSVEPVDEPETEFGDGLVELPLLGSRGGGCSPIEAIRGQRRAHRRFRREHGPGKPRRALTSCSVRGESMIDGHDRRTAIYVVVESPQRGAQRRDRRGAGSRAATRRSRSFYRKGSTPSVLEPANSDSIRADREFRLARTSQIRGVVTGLLRSY